MGGVAAALIPGGASADGAVRRMLSASPHRGTTHEVLQVGSCAIGVQRRDAADRAALAVCDGFAVAFTGPIDAVDVRRSAHATGDDQAVAESLCEILAQARERAPEHMRGDFAVVATDGERLWCFRDHVGYRGLFYRRDDDCVYAASEAKQVVAGSGIRMEPDVEVVERTFFGDTEGLFDSALRGVARLGAGRVLSSGGGAHSVQRYWHPERILETARLTADELQHGFDAVMSQAGRRVVTGDDVVLLSGGVDSPAIAAFAAEPHRERTGSSLKAFSFVYPNAPSVDERRYTEEVADFLGLELHIGEQLANPLGDLVEWQRLADSPIPVASMPFYAESYRYARELGARNVLCGELAEFVMSMPGYVLPHLVARRRVGAVVEQVRHRRRAGDTRRTLARELVAPLVPSAISAARIRARDRGAPDWLDDRRVKDAVAQGAGWVGSRWARAQVGGFDGTSASLAAVEVCQEVCGVVERRPWTDADVWEFFLSLPAEVKFPAGRSKTLARRLLRGHVPDSVLDRRDKTVFDEAVMQMVDYETLDRWLTPADHHVSGVDYRVLRQRLERRELSMADFVWAKDLAGVHAFLSLFD